MLLLQRRRLPQNDRARQCVSRVSVHWSLILFGSSLLLVQGGFGRVGRMFSYEYLRIPLMSRPHSYRTYRYEYAVLLCRDCVVWLVS